MSKLLMLGKAQAVKMQAIDIPGFACSEDNPDDWLLQLEGHDKRAVFIVLKKRVLLNLFADMQKHFSPIETAGGENV